MKNKLVETKNDFMSIKEELQTISSSLELDNKEFKKTLKFTKGYCIRYFGWVLFLWILAAVAIAFAQILHL